MDCEQFVCRAACTAEEYLGCFCKLAKPTTVPQAWSPPPQDELKINVDGAYISGNQHGAWGVIVRDSTGHVVAARAGRVDHVASAFDTELHAAEQALEVAAELGVLRLTVETDAILVQQALNRLTPDFSIQAHVIEDVKVQARLWFASCVFAHCRREANTAAHSLAKLGLSLEVGETLVLDDELPADVAASVLGDYAHNVE